MIDWQHLFFSYMQHIDESEDTDCLHLDSDVDNLAHIANLNSEDEKELRRCILIYHQEQRKVEGRTG